MSELTVTVVKSMLDKVKYMESRESTKIQSQEEIIKHKIKQYIVKYITFSESHKSN